MARVRFSAPAQSDLALILAASLERGGPAGRQRYAALLAEALRLVSRDPEGRATRDRAELLHGVRSLHTWHVRGAHGVKAPVHVVYHRVTSGGVIEVIRVLHERMDPSRHLGQPAAGPRRAPRRGRSRER